MWGDRVETQEYPLAGLPIQLVLGDYSLSLSLTSARAMSRRYGSLKPTPHTSERPVCEARKNAKKRNWRKRRHYNKANHPSKTCRVPPVCRGGRDEKGAMARQTTAKTLPRTVSVAGGARRRKANWRRTQALRQGKPKSKPSRRLPSWRGGETKRRKPTQNGKVALPTVPRGGGSA